MFDLVTQEFGKGALCVLLVFGAVETLDAAREPSPFEKPPAAAVAELKITRGKAIHTGLVFVNGHYLPPPYVVSRYGTVLRINGVQTTDQIVPWARFMGVAPAAAERPAPKPRAKAAKPETKGKGSTIKALDDLFDDDEEDTAKAAKPGASATPAEAAKAPEPTGPYVPNARNQAYLKRINDFRRDVDLALRRNEVVFFGLGYPYLHLEARLAREFMDVLPEALRDAVDGADLLARLRAKGCSYLTAAHGNDLIAHRMDYLALLERRQKLAEEAEFNKLLESGGGTTRKSL